MTTITFQVCMTYAVICCVIGIVTGFAVGAIRSLYDTITRIF